jgi:hypothetical protein
VTGKGALPDAWRRAPGSGAPKGNRNALKDGLHTQEARQEHKAVNDFIRQARRLARSVD